jgi:hypothetical protein
MRPRLLSAEKRRASAFSGRTFDEAFGFSPVFPWLSGLMIDTISTVRILLGPPVSFVFYFNNLARFIVRRDRRNVGGIRAYWIERVPQRDRLSTANCAMHGLRSLSGQFGSTTLRRLKSTVSAV